MSLCYSVVVVVVVVVLFLFCSKELWVLSNFNAISAQTVKVFEPSLVIFLNKNINKLQIIACNIRCLKWWISSKHQLEIIKALITIIQYKIINNNNKKNNNNNDDDLEINVS